ncbi:TetR/AcrR family transcriptional regulator [Amycolatopsis pithecellobii]|uniref:TetR family transcriptional regulator n=1 Tax=Amycolatopsis pithecellobii TaxID=664692 RepID=A0A6N7YZF0_9PSEU|nr:TetR/AcrR family transcriptional regulator [Amycolatopsis pithecellobii]MTD52590.1 TetR family transcriptional regulator [Amycolatopsis pithecellobii]
MSQRNTEAPAKPRRRTQAERSAATQERLLTATVECLYELGYHKTTTYTVEQRAGVTRGALLHHFASKHALLVGAVAYMVETAERQLVADTATVAGKNVGEELTDLLWRQFTSPTFVAFMEITMAARTDPALREALAESQNRLDALCRTAARNVAGHIDGGAIDDTTFGMGIELTIRYMRGAAGMLLLDDNAGGHDEIYREWQRLVAPYFTGSVRKTRRTAPRD